MKSVDTNVAVRFILGDDDNQSKTAAEVFRSPCFIPLTVLVETGWVLGASYGLDECQIAGALLALLDQPTVSTESEAEVRWALARYRDKGADLADMIHLVVSRRTEAFVTFDRKLPRQAGPDAPVHVDVLGRTANPAPSVP